jgi:uncharacterized protein (DUF1800 family)
VEFWFSDQNVTIKEKMTWFWYHFIPVDFTPCVVHHFHMGSNSCIVPYMKMFRDNPLGNYKTLIRKMATQPAMMYYLNNQANTKHLQTRILHESLWFFTLGKDPLSQYLKLM